MNGAIVSEQNRQIFTQQFDLQLDLKGLACPLPLLKMKLALKTLEPGQLVYVETTDAGSWTDFQKFAEITDNELVAAEKVAEQYHFVIKKG